MTVVRAVAEKPLNPIVWLGDTRERLREFPEDVKDDIGAALMWAQKGDKHPNAKPMKGFGGASVLEVVENYDGDTYRAVYTVKFAAKIFALHCFQKKSKSGSETPQHDIRLIRERLRLARQLDREWAAGKVRP